MIPFIPFIIATSIILLLAFGVVVAVVLYHKRLMRYQEDMRQLEENRQRQLLEAAVEAQEAERRRLARDLHDEVGTMLALVKLQAGQWAGSFDPDKTPGGAPPVTILKQKLEEVMSSVRRISHDLMPIVLTKFGLVQAIGSLKRSLPADSGVTVYFECNEPGRRLNQKLELTIYRIVQELLANTIKHAGATEVTIELNFDADWLELVYSDNGKGFDLTSHLNKVQVGGHGLTNLASRVALLNGTIKFNTENGAGITVTATFPAIQANETEPINEPKSYIHSRS